MNDASHNSIEDDDELLFIDDDEPQANASPEEPGAQGGCLILMVDDDPEVHTATVLALHGVRPCGRALRFEHAHSAREAREMLLARNAGELPDLVCMDMMMESALAGVELAAWIKGDARLSKIPLLLRSGQSGLAGELDRVRGLGVEGIASKGSMTRDSLIKIIETLLQGGRSFSDA